MRTILLVIPLGYLLICSTHASSDAPPQGPTTPAAWLPPDTLAYVEMPRPGPLAAALKHWVEGSCLADFPLRLPGLYPPQAQRAPAVPSSGHQSGPPLPDWLGPFATMLTREGLMDAERLGPLAWAVVGMGEDGSCQEVYVACIGQSSVLPALLRQRVIQEGAQAGEAIGGIRTFVIPEPAWRAAARAYRAANQPWRQQHRPGGVPQAVLPPSAGMEEKDSANLLIAFAPDAIVLGSREGVLSVLRGHQGERRNSTLAETPAFKEASKGSASAFFLFQGSPNPQQPMPPGLLPPGLTLLNSGSSPWAGQCRVRDENLEASANLPPGAATTIRKAMANSPVNQEILHFVPPSAVAAMAAAVVDGPRQWDAMTTLLQRLTPDGEDAVSRIGALERANQLSLAAELGPRLTNVACFLPNSHPHANGSSLVWIFEAKSLDAAQDWIARVLPRLFANPGGAPAAPTVREIDGVAIQEFDLGGSERFATARHENIVVLGADGDQVAFALKVGARRQGWLANDRVRQGLQSAEGANALGMVRVWPTALAMSKRREGAGFRDEVPGIGGFPFAGGNNPVQAAPIPLPGGLGNLRDPSRGLLPGRQGSEPDQNWSRLVDVSTEPLLFWVQPRGERWQVELRWRNPHVGLAQFAELWLAGTSPGAQREGGGAAPFLPGVMPPPGGPQPLQPPRLPPPPNRR